MRWSGSGFNRETIPRLLLLVAPAQDARPANAPRGFKETSMLDHHGKTDLLIARMKESLPIEADYAAPS
jgi:hypothetical protein